MWTGQETKEKYLVNPSQYSVLRTNLDILNRAQLYLLNIDKEIPLKSKLEKYWYHKIQFVIKLKPLYSVSVCVFN